MDPKTEQAEKKENTKFSNDIVNVCTMKLLDTILKLHEKALKESKGNEGEFVIRNSAIEGEGKSAKFFGAGEHIIAYIPAKAEKNSTLTANKKDAYQKIKTYIQWFSGPDVAEKFKEDALIPMEAEEISDKKETSDRKDISSKKNENVFIKFPSFLSFLKEVNDESTEESAEETTKEDNEEKTENNNQDKNENDNVEKKDEAPGYQVTYKLTIEGQKEHPLKDALKKFGSDVLDGIGIQTFNWKSGAAGKEHTIGGLRDALDVVFGKINPEKLLSTYSKLISQKFKKANTNSEIIDTKTILKAKPIKKHISAKEQEKIEAAEYALCTRVSKKDAAYKNFSPEFIADTVTRSIQGLFKKFKNKVTSNDVIHIGNSNEDPYKNDGKEGEVQLKDSIINKHNRLIIEDDKTNKEENKNKQLTVDKVKELLENGIKTASIAKECVTNIEILEANKIISELEKYDFNNSKIKKELTSHKYGFLITTEHENDEDKKEQVNSSIEKKSILNFLFEALKTNTTKIQESLTYALNNMLDEIKKLSQFKDIELEQYKDLFYLQVTNDYKDSTKEINDEKEKANDKSNAESNESIQVKFEILNELFEDISKRFVFEANSTYANEIIFKIKDIGIESIKANEKQIVDKFNSIIDKKKKDIDYKETDGYKAILNALFKSNSIDEAITAIEKIANEKENAKLLGYIKPCIEGIKKEDKEPPEENIEDPGNNTENNDANIIKAYWPIPDINGILDDTKQTDKDIVRKNTDYDYYIIPMKGLSYNTRSEQKES